MKIEALREAIETYPQRLSTAMEAVDKAEKAVEKLNEQIEEEEASLLPEGTTSTDSGQSDADREAERLKLDHELALLELEYDRLKGAVEMEYRRNPPEGDKVTEATVTAVVKSDGQLPEAKKKRIDKRNERKAANITRRIDFRDGLRTRRVENRVSVTSPKLEKLRERLFEAEIRQASAEMKLEEVKASLPTYQMLVQLYTAGLIK